MVHLHISYTVTYLSNHQSFAALASPHFSLLIILFLFFFSPLPPLILYTIHLFSLTEGIQIPIFYLLYLLFPLSIGNCYPNKNLIKMDTVLVLWFTSHNPPPPPALQPIPECSSSPYCSWVIFF